ncbi:MAG: hypothetical protein J6D30_04665 [Clostridia bacterium]|nr:hypothetical protein [Clostridia bacterium]
MIAFWLDTIGAAPTIFANVAIKRNGTLARTHFIVRIGEKRVTYALRVFVEERNK